jgi:hypothetical protein
MFNRSSWGERPFGFNAAKVRTVLLWLKIDGSFQK